VLLTIHQPRASIFDMADSVLLLAGGRVVYQGTPAYALPYFEGLGFPRSLSLSVPDYVLDVLNHMVPRDGGAGGTDLPDEWVDHQRALASMTPRSRAAVRRLQAHARKASVQMALHASMRRRHQRLTSLAMARGMPVPLAGAVAGMGAARLPPALHAGLRSPAGRAAAASPATRGGVAHAASGVDADGDEAGASPTGTVVVNEGTTPAYHSVSVSGVLAPGCSPAGMDAHAGAGGIAGPPSSVRERRSPHNAASGGRPGDGGARGDHAVGAGVNQSEPALAAGASAATTTASASKEAVGRRLAGERLDRVRDAIVRASLSFWANFTMSMVAVFVVCYSLAVYLRASSTVADDEFVLRRNPAQAPGGVGTGASGVGAAASNGTVAGSELVRPSQFYSGASVAGAYLAVPAAVLALEPVVVLATLGLVELLRRRLATRKGADQEVPPARRGPALSRVWLWCCLAVAACLVAFLASSAWPAVAFALSTVALLRLCPLAWSLMAARRQEAQWKSILSKQAPITSGGGHGTGGTGGGGAIAGNVLARTVAHVVVHGAAGSAGGGITAHLPTPKAVLGSPAASSAAFPLASRRAAAPACSQLAIFFRRSCKQQVAGARSQLLFLSLLAGLGVIIGLLFGPASPLNDLPLKMLLAEICLCLVAAATSMQLIAGSMGEGGALGGGLRRLHGGAARLRTPACG
jgi:hypothetical protein